MAVTITGALMTSDLATGHTCVRVQPAAAGEPEVWACSRLPGRQLSRVQAMAALTLCEIEADGGADSQRAAGYRAGLGI